MASNCSCDCDCEDDAAAKACPECGEKGKSVPIEAVKNLLQNDLKQGLKDAEYNICMESSCNVAYFNGDNTFYLEELRRPIWFKEDSEPKIACYCNDITYEQVKSAVREHDLTTWAEIVSHYREKRICMCDELNPTGECCSENFYRIVNETLKSLGKEPIPPKDQCCG